MQRLPDVLRVPRPVIRMLQRFVCDFKAARRGSEPIGFLSGELMATDIHLEMPLTLALCTLKK